MANAYTSHNMNYIIIISVELKPPPPPQITTSISMPQKGIVFAWNSTRYIENYCLTLGFHRDWNEFFRLLGC
jgi:hypothetical protein